MSLYLGYCVEVVDLLGKRPPRMMKYSISLIYEQEQ